MSVSTSMVPVEWNEHKLNLLDTPGYADFFGEVVSALRVADAALVVIDTALGRAGRHGASLAARGRSEPAARSSTSTRWTARTPTTSARCRTAGARSGTRSCRSRPRSGRS